MKETELQNLIRCKLSKFGIVIRLNTGNFKTDDGRYVKCGFTGLSDLLFLSRNGDAVFMEIKAATGRATKEQLNFIETVRKMGFRAGIVRSVSDALELIDCTNPNRKIPCRCKWKRLGGNGKINTLSDWRK